MLLLSGPAAADTAAVVADHARPGYAAFDDAVARLADVESCDPEALRPAFQAAYDAWMAVEHLHLGPAEENGRALAILFWPDPKGLGAKAQTALLTGDPAALRGGPPVTALFIQNTNPVTVAPEQNLVRQGFAREDLFTCVHEQFMTETAAMADVVLPATMFLEHDDVYQGGGHQHVMAGPKLIDPPGECRSNHEVVCDLAVRVGASHAGFAMTPEALADDLLARSGRGTYADLKSAGWRDVQPDFATTHYQNGFNWPDGRFRFSPDWTTVPYAHAGPMGPVEQLPKWPDHAALIEAADADHPFRLATSPARSFLNTTFNETPSSMKREAAPSLLIHPDDAARLGVGEGDWVEVGNRRGSVHLGIKVFDGVLAGVVIAESIFPNASHRGGRGINTLTGADPIAPFGGAAFHDNKVWIKKA